MSAERFLVTIPIEDLERIERMAKRQRMSRNRYVMMAVLAALKIDEGKEESDDEAETSDEHRNRTGDPGSSDRVRR